MILDKSRRWLSDTCPPGMFHDLTNETYEYAASVCKDAVTNILLPYFEKTKNAENARIYMREDDSLVAKQIDAYDMREIGFYIGANDYENAKMVLEYYIENRNKWNKRWWQKVENEYTNLLQAISQRDEQYLEGYKSDKKQATYDGFKWKG